MRIEQNDVIQSLPALSTDELQAAQGGVVITITTGALIGGGLAAAGFGAGLYFGSR